jgi:FkbM family methyltransferase
MRYEEKLIFDIGFNNGDDSRHYLNKGFNVLGIEADPILVEKGKKRFKKEIAEGRMTLLNVGIADKEGTLPFYRNHHLSEWSSFNLEAGSRNNTGYDVIEVRCVKTETLFESYGIPYYMKVDIEGFDHYCLEAIPATGIKPAYVSTEAVHLEWLELLRKRGYNRFKVINQAFAFKELDPKLERNKLFGKYIHIRSGIRMRLQKFLPFKYPYGSSGPFGEDTDGDWKTYEEVYSVYASLLHDPEYRKYNKTSWFDFHAKLGE